MKVVLITGGSGGIGSACVKAFYQAGFKVAFSYLASEEAALRLTEEFPGVLPIKADMRSFSDAENLLSKTVEQFGKIDILVNNAGVALQKLLTETTETEWDHLFAVNIRGAFLCSRAALSKMISAHSGSIVNISSVWGETGGSCEVAYSATKAALIGFTKALAKEVGPSCIRVNCVAPGVIDTNMNALLDDDAKTSLTQETPLLRLGTPQEIAQAVLFLADDQKSGFITGQVLGVNGGMLI